MNVKTPEASACDLCRLPAFFLLDAMIRWRSLRAIAGGHRFGLIPPTSRPARSTTPGPG